MNLLLSEIPITYLYFGLVKKNISLLLITLFVSCQNESNNPFIYNIGGDDFDEVYTICLDNDKNLITAGVFHNELQINDTALFSALGKTDLFVIKSDKQGKKIWTKQLGSNGSDWVYSVKSDSINNVYIAGQTTVKEKEVGLITKLDINGNILWKYNHDSISKFFDLIHTANKIFCSGTINGKAAIITLNENGVKLNEFHFPGNGIIRGFSVIDEESFYVFGVINQNGFIAKINSELKIEYKSTIPKIRSAIILSLISDENGVIAGGQILNPLSNFQKHFGKEDAFVTSLSHDLKVKKTIVNGSMEKDWTRSICRLQKGEYLISTIVNKNATIFDKNINNSKGNYDISLSLVDKDLNLISHKTIDSKLEEGVNAIQFNEGSIYIAGWYQGSLIVNKNLSANDNENGNGFVLKCDFIELFK